MVDCVYHGYIDEVIKLIASFLLCNSFREIRCSAVKFMALLPCKNTYDLSEVDGSSIILDLDKTFFRKFLSNLDKLRSEKCRRRLCRAFRHQPYSCR